MAVTKSQSIDRKEKLFRIVARSYEVLPTLTDLGNWTGFSHSTIKRYLLELEQAGRLKIENGDARRANGLPMVIRIVPPATRRV